MSRILLPSASEPEVSLVMVSYGKPTMTCTALAALAANTQGNFETIVVDNASPDGAADSLADGVDGLRLIRSDRNLGFGGAVNLGVAEARGRYVCVLNNDIEPQPGWLELMLRRMGSSDVGAVVPMLIGPDGLVQEAGVAMGSDGYSWRWGAGLPREAPEVAFPRVVDYGSGACLLVRKDAFLEAGGFRVEYGLGYLEDIDLCATLAQGGLRTLYEPAARVVHEGHGSFGAESASKISGENRPKFLERWGHAFANRPPLKHGRLHPPFTVRARDALASHRVLLVATDPAWVGLAHELGRLLPDARLTALVAAGGAEARSSCLANGIEVVSPEDPADWLSRRRGHADTVWVLDDNAMSAWGPALARSQRQAAWVVRDTSVLPRRSRATVFNGGGGPRPVVIAPPGRFEEALKARPESRVLPADTPNARVLAEVGVLVPRP